MLAGRTLGRDGRPGSPIVGIPLDGAPGVRAIPDTRQWIAGWRDLRCGSRSSHGAGPIAARIPRTSIEVPNCPR